VMIGSQQPVSIRKRNLSGLNWKSEGFIVPLEGKGQHNLSRGKGPCFVNATEEWRKRGLPRCYKPRQLSGHYRGSCIVRPSKSPPFVSIPYMTRYTVRILSIMHGALFVPIEVAPEWTELPLKILRKKKGKKPSWQNWRKHLSRRPTNRTP